MSSVANAVDSGLPVLVVGAGGHGRVVADALLAAGIPLLGFVDRDPSLRGRRLLGLPVLGEEDMPASHPPGAVQLANGVGSIADTRSRVAAFARFRERGYRFARVLHPSAVASRHAALGEGAQLMAGSIVQVDARLGDNVLVNTGASVDHDCVVEAGVHIAPGAVLSGNVTVGAGTHVGLGARLVQGVRIGRDCVIGAGAVVLEDVADGLVVVGVPARPRTAGQDCR